MKTLIPQIATIAILCLLLINAARSYAGKLNLIDRPAGRKQHVGEIPTVGGLAIYCAFFLGTSLDYGLFSAYAALLTAMGFLVVVGALDDAMDVSPFAKLAAQAISAVALVAAGGLTPIGWDYATEFGAPAMLASAGLTVTLILMTINAVNMVDGVDGLSGSLVAVSLAWLAFAGYLTGSTSVTTIIVRLIVPVVAFLAFNLRAPWRKRASVFMGDAGTMMLGCAIAWFCLELDVRGVPLLASGLVVAIPLVDTGSLFFRRIGAGKNPFRGDRQHLHHLLLAAGMDAASVTFVLTAAAALIGGVGIVGWHYHLADSAFVCTWLLIVATHTGLVSVLTHRAAVGARMTSRVETV